MNKLTSEFFYEQNFDILIYLWYVLFFSDNCYPNCYCSTFCHLFYGSFFGNIGKSFRYLKYVNLKWFAYFVNFILLKTLTRSLQFLNKSNHTMGFSDGSYPFVTNQFLPFDQQFYRWNAMLFCTMCTLTKNFHCPTSIAKMPHFKIDNIPIRGYWG